MIRREERYIRGSGLVNPNGISLRFSKLLTVAVGQQLHSESVNRLVRHALHEVYSGGDVSPLIASANLANAPVVSVQVFSE